MEVTRATTEQLSHYLHQLVNFSNPGLLVHSEDKGDGLALMVVQEFPAAGVKLVLGKDFLQSNQDAKVLEVIRDWTRHWLSRGLPEVSEDGYTTETVTLKSHGTS